MIKHIRSEIHKIYLNKKKQQIKSRIIHKSRISKARGKGKEGKVPSTTLMVNTTPMREQSPPLPRLCENSLML
ncbi:hypothetical protein QL285_003130 [Trifolium repens]|nr:hypothetical protein QL285_003130 [Trifolium repens]